MVRKSVFRVYSSKMILVLAFLIGVLTGLRSLTTPAVVSWVARAGSLNLRNTAMAFLATSAAAYLFTLCGILVLISD